MTTIDTEILLLGGTGRTGRRVADRLTGRGLPVRVGSRSGRPPFAWDDPHGWPALLDGVRAAYVAYAPDLAAPGADDHLHRLGRAAAAAGVERMVLLSGRGEPAAAAAEAALRAAGLPVAAVRCSWFAQDFSEHFLLGPVLDGVLPLPTVGRPGVAEAFVDLEDVADVVVELLLGAAPLDGAVALTGPRLVTFGEAADRIAAATGRPIAYLPCDVADFAQRAAADGVPAEEAAALAQLLAEVLDGRNESLTDDVRRLLGRPPTDFADYVRRTAASGVWSPAAAEVAS